MTPTAYAHIDIRDGVPYIEGTRTKVMLAALDEIVDGWDAAEIQRQRPDLTLGQIHSALAYYHDHRAEMEEAIRQADRFVDEMKRKHDVKPAQRDRLRASRLPL